MRIELGKGPMRLSKIAELVGGEIVPKGNDPEITSVCTDSREATAGALFLAIRGERVDGHRFAESAYARGAAAVLCERPAVGGISLLVKDTVLALGELASRIRDYRVFAVTGSVGKTTTKDMVYEVLSRAFCAYKSRGNYNSNIGMPMSMLEAGADTEVAVLEMGMSARGEIRALSEIARPELGMIVNIGTAHMESLGSRENIAKAKLELLDGIQPGGRLLLSGDEPLLLEALDDAARRGITPITLAIHNGKADYRAVNIRYGIGETTFDLLTPLTAVQNLRVPAMGEHHVYAALFAATAGIVSGAPEEAIREGLLAFAAPPMRQQIEELGGILLMEDCYNSSPESVSAAISVMKTIARTGKGRMLALLGDMRELGAESPTLHRRVGEEAAREGVEFLFTFGELSSTYLAAGAAMGGLPPEKILCSFGTDSPETVGEAILKVLRAGDILLVKASRALAAERITAYLRERL